ncbi:MAG: prolyl oligopeptidase family serine peptidase [Longimicrobiales bacterium]|nr:prolyl oligopeptidase family serine peptidase [Longimicrobiales bacterium]
MRRLPIRTAPRLAAATLLAALSAVFALSAAPVHAQQQPVAQQRQAEVTGKKLLDHDVYDGWRALRDRRLSPDGRWIAFRYVPGEGDAELVIRRTDSDQAEVIPRGGPATLTGGWEYAVFTIAPAHAAVRQARRDEVKPVDMPKDTLAILRVGDAPDGAVRIPAVSGFKVPAEAGALVAYLLEEEEETEGDAEAAAAPPAEPGGEPAPEAGPAEEEDEEAEKPERGKGKTLVLRDLASGQEWRFEDVKEYAFTPRGEALAFTRVTEDGAGDGAFLVDTGTGEARPLHEGMGRYQRLTVETDGEGTGVAFLTDAPDWQSETPEFTLMVASAADGDAARAVAAAGTNGVPAGWVVSEHGELEFSRAGRRLFFGTAPRPLEAVEDTLLDEDRVKVDVWNWKDPYLQPMQLVQLDDELERTYRAVAHLDAGDRVVQLADETLPAVTLADEGEGDHALAYTDLPYRQLVSWDGRYNDVYAVDVRTGERRLVQHKLRGFSPGQVSPGGRYVAWWDEEATSWMAAPMAGGAPVNLSANIPHPTWDVLDDHPQGLPPESFPVWTEGDREVLIADPYDLWVVDPASGAARSLTEETGRREGIRFRYARVDPEERAVPRDKEIHLNAFHLTTKASGIYRDRVEGTRAPRRVVWGDRAYDTPLRAEEADRYIVSWSTFRDYPEYRATDASLDGGRVLTETNPQQAEYSWGTAETVEWISTDGEPLQGILYKPEGFDPSRKYPMMVYFYERMSDGLHRHITPAPGSSSVNFAFYVSRGYLLFIPDIPYKIGWPGESAMNAVMPGVLRLMATGFVDEDRIGVQGHSWGGYQISYMITRTNLFAAAEAGAPVANMTSAYGGIRWGSGMSRAFQYERTQSRIGGTLWDAQHRYIENSPLFQADKVETPLLMMHNDEDGAVPWYQGIEYFSALRRLGKPVWMLNYNGEDHGLRQRKNQKDWTVRMQQFFDHYLMDAPPPVWLEYGVPAVLKGRTLGLELVETRRPIS